MPNNDFSAIARRVPREGVYYLTTTERLAIVSPHEIAVVDTTLQKVFYAYNSVWYDSAPAGPVTGFDALAPTTTRGDLIARGASANARLAIGASGTALKSDGTDPAWGYQIANVATSELGYLLLPTIFYVPPSSVGTSSILLTSNAIRAVQLVIPFRIIVTEIRCVITTLQAAKVICFALYNAAGTALLLEVNDISTAATGAIATTISSFVIEPGVYFYAWSGTASSAVFSVLALNANFSAIFDDGSSDHIGNAANVYSGGFPSSLGTITYASIPVPMLLLKP